MLVKFKILFILFILYLERIVTSDWIEEGLILLSKVPSQFKFVLNHLDYSMEGKVGH